MKKIQVTARNVQKAIEQGLKELGVKQEDVDIKVLDEGGLFRKAKVELIYDDGLEEEKVNKEIKKEEKEIEKKLKKEIKEDLKQNKKEQNFEEKSEKSDSVEKVAVDFLSELFEKMDIKADISFVKTDLGYSFNASGEKVNYLIGKRGETLNAIQELLSNVIKASGFKNQKVFFDVENYKNRRELTLVKLANRIAHKALKIGKPVKLERMSAYERKIIHTALQDFDGVTTKSEGEEPNRCLVVIPKK